jgi:hypothetical protein
MNRSHKIKDKFLALENTLAALLAYIRLTIPYKTDVINFMNSQNVIYGISGLCVNTVYIISKRVSEEGFATNPHLLTKVDLKS